jgi:predicted enzyme related to lactoylglutathione lyase
MDITEFNINITSEQPDTLIAWYRDVLQLAPSNLGEWAFQVGQNAHLVIDGHSEVHGPAKEPQRYLINFMVDDLAKEQGRLESMGVTFIRKAGKEAWGGVISTFLDPDGNYLQLLEYHPDATAEG